jgi:hypothetical protein
MVEGWLLIVDVKKRSEVWLEDAGDIETADTQRIKTVIVLATPFTLLLVPKPQHAFGLSVWERCLEIQGHVKVDEHLSCSQGYKKCEVYLFVYSSCTTPGQPFDGESILALETLYLNVGFQFFNHVLLHDFLQGQQLGEHRFSLFGEGCGATLIRLILVVLEFGDHGRKVPKTTLALLHVKVMVEEHVRDDADELENCTIEVWRVELVVLVQIHYLAILLCTSILTLAVGRVARGTGGVSLE